MVANRSLCVRAAMAFFSILGFVGIGGCGPASSDAGQAAETGAQDLSADEGSDADGAAQNPPVEPSVLARDVPLSERLADVVGSQSIPGIPEMPKAEPAIENPIRGTVYTSSGASAIGANVELFRRLAPWPLQSRKFIAETDTNSEGRFEFRVPVTTLDLFVRVRFSGHAALEENVHPQQSDMALEMTPGFEVRGSVVLARENRQPRGCEVTLEPSINQLWPAMIATTTTNGEFVFPRVPPGTVRVVARFGFFEPAVRNQVTVGAKQNLRMEVVDPGLTVEGTILSAETGIAVENADVLIYPNVWNWGLHVPVRGRTTRGGEFSIPGLGRGSVRIHVQHQDFSTAVRHIALFSKVGENPEPVGFELTPRSIVSGQLTGEAFGELWTATNARGEEVSLLLETTLAQQGRCVVAEDGTFEFPLPFSSGPARLSVTGGILSFGRSTASDLQVLVVDGGETDWKLEVEPPTRIRGTVQGSEGQPILGASIRLAAFHGKLPMPPKVVGVTDRAGRFDITGLPATQLELLVDARGFASASVPTRVPPPGEEIEMPTVVLDAPGSIHGQVTRGGRPVEGATVYVSRQSASRIGVTGADGRYSLHGLAPGPCAVKARFSSLPIALAPDVVNLKSGTTVRGVNLTFPAGRRIEGIVSGGGGQPVKQAAITVGSGSAIAYSGMDGRFEFEVPEGPTQLTVYSPDLTSSVTIDVGAEQETVDAQLATPPQGTLRMRLLGLPQNRALDGALLRVLPMTEDGQPVREVRRGYTESLWVPASHGGNVEVLLPAGTSRLAITHPDFASIVREVTVEVGGLLELDTVVMEPGSTVQGRVVDEAGEPIAGADVYLGRTVDWQQLASVPGSMVRSGGDGTFEISGVSGRNRRVVAMSNGYAPSTVDLRLPRDVLSGKAFPIVLRRGTVLHVVAKDAESQPITEGIVIIKVGETFLDYARIGEDQAAVFANLADGTYGLTLFGDESMVQEVEVSREEGSAGAEDSTKGAVQRTELQKVTEPVK